MASLIKTAGRAQAGVDGRWLRVRCCGLAVLMVSAAVIDGAASAAPRESVDVSPPTVGLTPATNRAIAERGAALLENRYVVPVMGAKYAATLRLHAARGDYAGIRDPAALAARMTADVQAVAPDGHLRFYRIEAAVPPPVEAPASTAVDARTPPGIRDMRWLETGVAYLSFEHFDDRVEAMTAVAGFLRDHAQARALVIDSRGNHGGAFDMMGLLANHLFAAPRLLADMDMASAVVAQYGSPFPVDGKILRRTDGPPGLVRFEHWAVPVAEGGTWSKMPVYYLTSRETFSAAEHLAMILKSTRRGVLIGETTGGGNHFGGTEPVGGGLELFVPVGHTTDPATGLDWEGGGITPDISVPASDALDEALRQIHAAARTR